MHSQTHGLEEGDNDREDATAATAVGCAEFAVVFMLWLVAAVVGGGFDAPSAAT